MPKLMSRRPSAATEAGRRACDEFVATVVSTTGLARDEVEGVLNLYLREGQARIDHLNERVLVRGADFLSVEMLRRAAGMLDDARSKFS